MILMVIVYLSTIFNLMKNKFKLTLLKQYLPLEHHLLSFLAQFTQELKDSFSADVNCTTFPCLAYSSCNALNNVLPYLTFEIDG